MNILSIGNSFSQDATRYLYQVARTDGTELNTFNLYIGGCSLSRHYRNMLSGDNAYELGVNGHSTGFFVSLEKALLNRDWDVITFQQVSQDAPDYATYQPYLSELSDYVFVCCPKSKQVIHQTWAYEKDSDRLTKELGYTKPEDMFNDIKSAYEKAAKDINADFIIPSGEILLKLSQAGMKVHRDTFHASLGAGRYALALCWYKALTGKRADVRAFSDFDVPVSETEIELIDKIL